MKLRNLAFFGVMASILSVASAQAAEGDNYIASKGYVDTKVGTVTTNLGDNYYTKSAVDTELAKKQDTITDLGTIRSGAAAGATALQSSDVDQTYNAESTNAQSGTAVAEAISGVSSDMSEHIADTVKHITAAERTAWNGKQDAITSTNKLSGTLISDGTVGTAQLSEGVNASLTKADTALQNSDLTDYATKAYADGKASDAQSAAISAAAADATSKANTAESNANTYTNAEIEKLDSSAAATAGSVLTGVTVVNGKITDKTEVALPTVDQTYNAESTNAQSGTAVAEAISGVSSDMSEHIADTVKHITAAERTAWNGKQDAITSTNKLSGTLISDGTVDTAQLSTAVNNAINAANNAAAAVSNTATNTMSVVTYNNQGVITGGTAANDLAIASLGTCPEGKNCVVTKNSDGTYAYTPIQE